MLEVDEKLISTVLVNLRKGGKQLKEAKMNKERDKKRKQLSLKRAESEQVDPLYEGDLDSPDKFDRRNAEKSIDDKEDNEGFANNKFEKLKLGGKLKPDKDEAIQNLDEADSSELDKKAAKGKAIRQNSQHDDLEEYNRLLKLKIGSAFVTNVLRVALNMKEERIAGKLVAYYKCVLDEKMIIRAIKSN